MKALPQASSGYFWKREKAVITITPDGDGFRKKGRFGVVEILAMEGDR
jgi:hypothetical protein